MTGCLVLADAFAHESQASAFEVELALRATGYPALRNLAVVVHEGAVSIRGLVPSYHMIQIAIAAATPVAVVRQIRIELDVICGSSSTRRNEFRVRGESFDGMGRNS